MSSHPRNRLIALGEVARPHGVRGELRIRLFRAESDLVLEQEEITLEHKGERTIHRVESARRADEAILLKLEGVHDRDAAGRLRGASLLVARDAFPPLEEGEFYFCDVIGARVELRGEEVGVLEEVVEYPTVDVFVVRPPDGGRVWEIPVTGSYIESVDADHGQIVLRSLEGLERG